MLHITTSNVSVIRTTKMQGVYMLSVAEKGTSPEDEKVPARPQLHIVEKDFDTVGKIEHTPFGMRQPVAKGERTGYYYPETKVVHWIPD